jgi:hypothetical protein
VLAPGFAGIEIPNKTNGFGFRDRYLDQGAGRAENLDRFAVETIGGVDESFHRFAVEAG